MTRLELAQYILQEFKPGRSDEVVSVEFPAPLTADIVLSDGTKQRVTGLFAVRLSEASADTPSSSVG